MTRIVKYGVELVKLRLEDIELVRNWRNAQHVKQNMAFTGYINASSQRNWFEQLDTNANYYFMIIYSNKKIGIVNIKNIKDKIGEAGIFIGDPLYLHSTVSFSATLCMMEFAFNELGLVALLAKVNSKNTKVIAFNKALGYQLLDGQSGGEFNYFKVGYKDFTEATATIRRTLEKITV